MKKGQFEAWKMERNMNLSQFSPEAIKKRNADAEEDERIMSLLGRFTARMLLERLREGGGHPEPEWGRGETWRSYYLRECERRGIRLLQKLGWPVHDNAKYINIHTGSVERLIDVRINKYYMANRRNEYRQVWSVVEHWEPFGNKDLIGGE